jgi:hypothetical protein
MIKNFEQVVIEETLKMLPHSEARFRNGLFVECSDEEADALQDLLLARISVKIGVVWSRVSKSTVVYDFV